MKIIDFETLFRASPYPQLVMDKESVILDVNEAFLNLVNASKSTVLGKYVTDVIAEKSKSISLIHHNGLKDELKKTRHNDSFAGIKFVDTNVENELDKLKAVFVIQQQDDTPTTASEIENLKLLAQRKDAFLAQLSHELRNPISSINAAAEILSLAKPDPARLQKMTEVIKRQVNLLVNLVDDLSDVSHIATGLVNDMRVLDLAQVTSEAIEHNNAIIQARNHNINVEAPVDGVNIIGDHKRMLQVLKNLLSNAARYTPKGGNIWVKLTEEQDCAVVNVIDDGNGIAPDVLPKIFDLFSHGAEPLDHLNHGLGIGLAVVKNIIEAHGGTVKAFNNVGTSGSRFEIRLPAAALGRAQSE